MLKIHQDFISLLRKYGAKRGFQCNEYESKLRKTNNIIELKGNINCLIYCKIRSGPPYQWGITTNRINELKSSRKKWFIILLFETSNNGYLLTANDVERYLNEKLWPIGSDRNKNEYKISRGKTLKYNKPFENFLDLLEKLPFNVVHKMSYDEYPPDKISTTIMRSVRDTTLSNIIKEERNYQCQVCGIALKLKGKYYAETHHVKPLGLDGPDVRSNMLVLCPNHHVLFDYGEIAISLKDFNAIIDSTGNVVDTLNPPSPNNEYIEYHFKNIYKK